MQLLGTQNSEWHIRVGDSSIEVEWPVRKVAAKLLLLVAILLHKVWRNLPLISSGQEALPLFASANEIETGMLATVNSSYLVGLEKKNHANFSFFVPRG